MYYKGNQMVKKLYKSTQEIKAVYIGDKKVYPNIVDQNTGYDYTDWIYNLPNRTRTETPWTQDVYTDGSLGEKVFGTPTSNTETATIVESYEPWKYTITTTSGTRTRIVNNTYIFTDTTKTAFKGNQTENGERSQSTWSYNWVNSTRTATISYKFSDEIKTESISENGSVTYNFTITPSSTNAISAGGGTISISSSASIGKKWNNVVITTATSTIKSLKFSGNIPTGFTISSLNVQASNRGRTEGAILTANVCGITEIDGKNIESSTITINQQANSAVLSGGYQIGNAKHGYSDSVLVTVGKDENNENIEIRNINVYIRYSSGSTQTVTNYANSCELTINTYACSWVSIYSSNISGFTINYNRNTTNQYRSCTIGATLTLKNSNITNGIYTSILFYQEG